MANYRYLPPRMLYMWSDIYGSQLKNGEDYHQLNPVISIWLLTDELFQDTETYHHHFQLIDKHHQRLLSEHCSIHVIELNKWKKHKTLNQNENWLYFLKEAKHWNSLPSELNTPVMRSAMKTLQQFSEKEREYHLYQSRQNAIRDELSKQRYFEEVERNHIRITKDIELVNDKLKQANKDVEKANKNTEQAELKLEHSKEEIEALQAKLRAAGLI
jgi:predicted transposase/invertase (TIGR01784 family)